MFPFLNVYFAVITVFDYRIIRLRADIAYTILYIGIAAGSIVALPQAKDVVLAS